MRMTRLRRVHAVIDRILRGERLVCLERPWAGTTMVNYYFHPSWQPASAATVVDAMMVGEIKYVGTTNLGGDRYAVWGV